MAEQNPAPKTNRTAWIVVAVLLGGAALLCALTICVVLYFVPARLGNFAPTQQTTETSEQSLAVGTAAELIVDNEVGGVEVRTGDVDEIQVEYTKTARASNQQLANDVMEQIQVDIVGTENTVRVSADLPTSLGGSRNAAVDFVITVPSDLARLEIMTSVGGIRVEDVEAELAVSTGVGAITIDRVTLTSASEIKTNIGDLAFDGTLPAVGRVQISASVGDVRIQLPADSTFQLNARSGTGTIYTDFEVNGSGAEGADFIGDELSGSVGADPATLLVVEAGTGDIRIEQK